jgi:hypothetical protein
LPAVIDRARQLIGDAELLLGEFGFSSAGRSEASQANFYRDVLYYANQKGIVHLGVWTLYDFPTGTHQCGAAEASTSQLGFGLYRLDGSAKPAASVLGLAFRGVPPSAPSAFGIANPSFEEIDPVAGQVDGWRSWDTNWSRQARFVQDCTVARSGRCSARVVTPGGLLVGAYTDPEMPVAAGQRYSLQGYLRTERLAGWAQIALAWFDSDGRWLGSDASSPKITGSSSPQWTLVGTGAVLPPPGADHFQAYIQMYADEPSAKAWFDDISLQVVAAR